MFVTLKVSRLKPDTTKPDISAAYAWQIWGYAIMLQINKRKSSLKLLCVSICCIPNTLFNKNNSIIVLSTFFWNIFENTFRVLEPSIYSHKSSKWEKSLFYVCIFSFNGPMLCILKGPTLYQCSVNRCLLPLNELPRNAKSPSLTSFARSTFLEN